MASLPGESEGNTPNSGKRLSMFERRFGPICRHPLLFIVVLVLLGGSSVAIMDVTDYYFSSDNFCAFTCHVMEDTVYQELQESKHWNMPSGVRPTCANCHVAGRLTFAMWDHFIGTGELFVWLRNDFSKPETFEKLRPAAADRARFEMLENDSENCRTCHVMEAIKPKRKRGQTQHKNALEDSTTCIACHYNLVHKEIEPSDAFLEAIGEK